MTDIHARIAEEIGAREAQVAAAVKLLDEGATVPFVARYRKEATGGLDDTQLRTLEERLAYLRELDERRAQVLVSIEEQGRLEATLKAAILAAETKTRLEDLYLPYKPKRRTKAEIAREAGLEPLARGLLADPGQAPAAAAAAYLDPKAGVETAEQALEGARHILMEAFSENADLVGRLREKLWSTGLIRSRVAAGKEQQGAKFRDYFDHAEPIAKIPSHRLLALFRARNEGVLYLELALPGDDPDAWPVQAICAACGIADRGRPADGWLLQTAASAWRVKIRMHLTLDLFGRAREAAEAEAIKVFSDNLKDLLLAAPAGARATLGLDPGLKTGVKVAVVDATGRLVAHSTIHPHPPRKRWTESLATLRELVTAHAVALVAIGNGTASRETEALVAELCREPGCERLSRVVVSEAGASVYSASAVAAREFPQLDVAIRGAVSIARRLQDPLAELVKIDPKAIGVGQYQHDVNQVRLARALEARVEDCVNAVGVALNTASAALLARVAGLSPSVAEQIVAWRDAHGPFPDREALLEVPRLGPKTFQQAAGFLRIEDGSQPLDASGVHPEAYGVVERILQKLAMPLAAVLGNAAVLRPLEPAAFTDDRFGEPTVRDILAELEKPGRDPRPAFRMPKFDESVRTLADLAPGMVLEGAVSNVTNFGAFVDVGVHQDGLVHISQLSDRYVDDPRKVVKAGDVVKVKVLEVDTDRRRIGLTMRLAEAAPRPGRSPPQARGAGSPAAKPTGEKRSGRAGGKGPRRGSGKGAGAKSKARPARRGSLGDALAEAMAKKK